MTNIFLKLSNDKIINLNLATIISKSDATTMPYCIYFCDSGKDCIYISQEEYEKIHEVLFGYIEWVNPQWEWGDINV